VKGVSHGGTDSDLKPGSDDLNLTAGHFSSTDAVQPTTSSVGAAFLLTIVSGNGGDNSQWQNGRKGTRLLSYEPFGLVHQWEIQAIHTFHVSWP